MLSRISFDDTLHDRAKLTARHSRRSRIHSYLSRPCRPRRHIAAHRDECSGDHGYLMAQYEAMLCKAARTIDRDQALIDTSASRSRISINHSTIARNLARQCDSSVFHRHNDDLFCETPRTLVRLPPKDRDATWRRIVTNVAMDHGSDRSAFSTIARRLTRSSRRCNSLVFSNGAIYFSRTRPY